MGKHFDLVVPPGVPFINEIVDGFGQYFDTEGDGKLEDAARHQLMAYGFSIMLAGLGEDPFREGLRDTPQRVAKAWMEIFAGVKQNPAEVLTTTFSDEEHQEMVMLTDIPFYSMCEHHFLPFHGKAHVAYIPGKSGAVVGISKLARLVEGFAKRPQIQERLTSQIAETLKKELDALGVMVVIEAEHMCMTMRGVKKAGSITTTSAVRGVFRTVPEARQEFMSLIRK